MESLGVLGWLVLLSATLINWYKTWKFSPIHSTLDIFQKISTAPYYSNWITYAIASNSHMAQIDRLMMLLVFWLFDRLSLRQGRVSRIFSHQLCANSTSAKFVCGVTSVLRFYPHLMHSLHQTRTKNESTESPLVISIVYLCQWFIGAIETKRIVRMWAFHI